MVKRKRRTIVKDFYNEKIKLTYGSIYSITYINVKVTKKLICLKTYITNKKHLKEN